MKFTIPILAFVGALAVSSYAQVDTLTATEIGTFSLSDSIRQLYIQNLDNDSLNEIILCTASRVYVYRFGNNQPLWVSPVLVRPEDLQFTDIDGDSLIDIGVRDSANISLYNPHDSTLIYSMAVPNLFKCYTIGDANNDGHEDLAIVTQEPFDASSREDSVWTDILYGSDFGTYDRCAITMANYAYQDPYGQYRVSFGQHANDILIAFLGTNSSLSPRIIITSKILAGVFAPSPDELTSGGIWIINPINFSTILHQQVGLSDTINISTFNNNRILISPLFYLHTYSPGHPPNLYGYAYKELIGRFSASGFIDTTRLVYDAHESIQYPQIPFWSYSFGEINGDNLSNELCFGFMDSLKEYSINSRTYLWAIRTPADSFEVKGVYNSISIFQSPEVAIRETVPTAQYLFINGTSHQLDAILPNIMQAISQIADINADGNDEILSLSGNTLYIYNLDWATPVEENPILPGQYLIVSNYPNPFNSNTIIKYNLPRGCNIMLEIYDLLGRRIKSIEKSKQPAGFGQMTWDASEEPSGVYFYRLTAGNENKTGRMILLK